MPLMPTRLKTTDFQTLPLGATFYLPNDLKGRTGRGPVLCTKTAADAYTEEGKPYPCVTLNPRVVVAA
jgi:hypothetical protein